jgi:hypothetical protein
MGAWSSSTRTVTHRRCTATSFPSASTWPPTTAPDVHGSKPSVRATTPH